MEPKRSLSGRMFLRVCLDIDTDTLPMHCTFFQEHLLSYELRIKAVLREILHQPTAAGWPCVSVSQKEEQDRSNSLDQPWNSLQGTRENPAAQILFNQVTLKLRRLILSEMEIEIPQIYGSGISASQACHGIGYVFKGLSPCAGLGLIAAVLDPL